MYHIVSCCSHESKRPIKSIHAAEILATGQAIDYAKVIASAYRKFLKMEIDVNVVLDSKALFSTLSTCRNSIDRSIRADVSVIRYEFETQKVNSISCIPGKTSITDPLTKPNSPLVDALILSMFSRKISISLTDILSKNSASSTG